REELDRDETLEPRVSGAVYLAHPAGAESGNYFVRAKTCAGSKGQARPLYGRDAALPLSLPGEVRQRFDGEVGDPVDSGRGDDEVVCEDRKHQHFPVTRAD